LNIPDIQVSNLRQHLLRYAFGCPLAANVVT